MAVKLAAAGMLGLSAVTLPTVGAGIDVQGTQNYGLQVEMTGAPGTGIVLLQGTLDPPTIPDASATWFTLLTWDITAIATGAMLWATYSPVRRIRSNLTVLTGGTAPTVTAKMSAV
jgi:hypothetical protein